MASPRRGVTHEMKNKTTILIITLLLLAVGLGCNLFDQAQKSASGTNNSNSANSNKTLTDRALDTALGQEKIGIAECDEVVDILAAQANDPDDNFVTKALKVTALNEFRQKVKAELKDKKGSQADVAKFCREFKSRLPTTEGEPADKK